MQETHTETLKEVLKYLNGRYVLCGATFRLKYFPNFCDQETLDISTHDGPWPISEANYTSYCT